MFAETLYRRLAKAAAVLAVLILFIAVAVPLLVRREATRWVSARTHRTLTIDAIRFNPLSLRLTMHNLRLSEPDAPQTDFFAFSRLETALSLRSVIDRALIIRDLRISNPRLMLVRTAANSYNFADLLAAGKSPDDAKPSGRPLHFSINNIDIVDGSIDFYDRVPASEQHHRIEQLAVGIPFVGNVPYLTDLFVTPRLDALVNGTPFHFAGRLKPFKDGAETGLHVELEKLDLGRYAPYLPADLPLRVQQGELDSSLDLVYRVARDRKPELELSGKVALRNLRLNSRDGESLFRLAGLTGIFQPSYPLAGNIDLAELRFDQPALFLRRSNGGAWNFSALTGDTPPAARKTASPPRLRCQRLGIQNGEIVLEDHLPPGGYQTRLKGISAAVDNFDNRSDQPARIDLALQSERSEALTVNGDLTLSPLIAAVNLQLDRLDLAALTPYLQTWLTVPLSGRLSAGGQVLIHPQDGIALQQGQFLLDQIQLADNQGEAVGIETVSGKNIAVDLKKRSAVFGELLLDNGRFNLSRTADGRLAALAFLRPTTAATPAAAPFDLHIEQLQCRNWQGWFRDAAADARFSLQKGQILVSRLTYPALAAERLQLDARLDGGRLRLDAGGRLQPADLKGRLQIDALPLPPFWFYAGSTVRILPVSADLSGDLRFQYRARSTGPGGTLRGSLRLADLYLVDADNADDLLRWESLSVDGLDLDLDQKRLRIDSVALAAPDARFAVSADGRLNLVGLMQTETTSKAESAAPEATKEQSAWGVAVQNVSLQNGRIDFVDRHMSPPFSMAMRNLGGRISNLSTAVETIADVDLRGNLENRSPLQIRGTMNPLSATPQLNLQFACSDIDLSPVTPYSGRYLGYSIERGKLFLDLDYKIAEKRLQASNKLFVDQFSFGQSVDSPDDLHLPVRLAVALLKDRQGEIHLDLPLSGRTDDPEFSVWRIVVQMLKNLLIKAATSPLSLLTAFAGNEEFSAVVFPPGRATLSDGDRENLGRLAAALIERPGVKLQLSGFAEAAIDAEPYRLEILENRLRRVRFLELVKERQMPADADPASIVIAEPERHRLLLAVYKNEKFPRPRNLFGLLKELPDTEMEKLILAHIVIGPEELDALARARSNAVMNELVGRGLPATRLFQSRNAIVRPGDRPQEWNGNRVEFSIAAD